MMTIGGSWRNCYLTPITSAGSFRYMLPPADAFLPVGAVFELPAGSDAYEYATPQPTAPTPAPTPEPTESYSDDDEDTYSGTAAPESRLLAYEDAARRTQACP